MRRFFAAALFFFALCFPVRGISQEEMDETIAHILSTLEIGALEQAGEGTFAQHAGDLTTFIGQIASGKATLSPEGILASLKQQAYQAAALFGKRAIMIVIPALLSAIIHQISAAFSFADTVKTARFCCFLFLLLPLTALLWEQTHAVSGVVSDMSKRMQLLFPILLTLLSAVGGSATSAFMQPALLSASAVMTQVVTQITLRLCICAGIVTAANHLSGKAHLNRLCALLKRLAGWSMGICFTVFIGVMTIQGVGSAVSDGISLRMAKYAVNHFVPVVGGMFSDTVDMLVGCSLLVKNALGVVALLILLSVIFSPLLQLGAAQLIVRLCAAVLEPVTNSDIAECMDDYAGILSLLFTTLLCVGAMFFLLVAQLLLVGNLTVMMR